jgi:serine protease
MKTSKQATLPRGRTKLTLIATGLAMAAASPMVFAGDQVRVSWDNNPHSEAVIGFNASAGSSIKIGTTTNESNWQTKTVNVQRKFDNSSTLTSNFVRLNNLAPDTEYYFKLCSSSCTGQGYYFKTAPNSPRDMTVISGGDSRSSYDGRLQGNRLVAKIRPDYITFGGDYTNNNQASDMSTWLDHWQESFSVDQIDGKTFSRVYPIIPTFGNHEAGNPDTLCETFGTDPNGDGVCSSTDNYFAMSIGGNQTRVYTLNTEFKDNATLWSQQKTWLTNDLAAQGSQVSWRLGQYHRTMVPTGGGKTSYSTIRQWAPIFESGKMNLITESDTHIVKYTWPVVPSGSSYTKVDAGTVYLGEGSWGVGTRTTDTPQSWLADNASFKQFKVIQFNGSKIDVRTVKFTGESSTSTLTRSQRQADALALPAGLDLWDPSGTVGKIYTLSKAANQLTQVDAGTGGGGGSGSDALENGVAKTSLSANKDEAVNFSFAVPGDASNLNFVTTGGSGDSDMYVRYGAVPTTDAYDCRPYKNGNEETCTPAVQTGTYHVMLQAYASFSGLSLTASFDEPTGGNTGGSFTQNDLTGSTDNWQHFSIDVPAGMSSLNVDISGGTGDADLYIRAGSQPTSTVYECRPYKDGNTENCLVANPAAGTWHLSIKAYKTYQGLNLNAVWAK